VSTQARLGDGWPAVCGLGASFSVLALLVDWSTWTKSAFSVFWTAIALRLVAAPFHLGQRGIAIFALVGAGGAATAPLAGRAGDRGWTRATTLSAHLLILAALSLAAWAGSWPSMPPALSLALLGASAVLLDVGATADQTLGRRAVNLSRPEARSRLHTDPTRSRKPEKRRR
jgi:hypothetical protein